jgi:hypothetical protein
MHGIDSILNCECVQSGSEHGGPETQADSGRGISEVFLGQQGAVIVVTLGELSEADSLGQQGNKVAEGTDYVVMQSIKHGVLHVVSDGSNETEAHTAGRPIHGCVSVSMNQADLSRLHDMEELASNLRNQVTVQRSFG